MSKSEQSTEELPTETAVDEAVAPKSAMAQALADRKAAVAKNVKQPPFPALRENHKAKRIGNSPRGTRRSMGKR
ncbi:MAG TPA: hypothetical protein ENK35_07950 [Candidatus Tenderia sp.]|nr:hypothetical protein [Candidatus Tenderia sp.]